MITAHQKLRDAFSAFWKDKKHKEIPPISLVPQDDPTTLFTGSGMQQLVPNLLGQPHPLGKRLYNIQRAFRSQDIDEVGDNRHTTFFEMMGNWSLGDYFKNEQLPWFWHFLTKELHLPKNRLYITVFKGNKQVPKDEESARIWKQLGVSNNHIYYYDASKNWWSRSGKPEDMPRGEIGGPDSEVFYKFSEVKHSPEFGKKCHPNCDCGRFLEIGNSVFIQYKKLEDGTLEDLPNKNVDFGGGFERTLAAIDNSPDIFTTDAFAPIISSIESISNIPYKNNRRRKDFQIIADHLRAATFMIADGVNPSNAEQGYFLRRLIRRSIRFSRNLKLKDGFASKVANVVIETFKEAYPNLEEQKDFIKYNFNNEEKKFQKTLSQGLKEFNRLVSKKKLVTGKDAFFLYESYGFPVEMTKELSVEKNIPVNLIDFEQEKALHKHASREGFKKKFKGGLADTKQQTIKLHTATHLLHQALRDILGDHIQQKGSNITADRLRFDFSHSEKLSKEQIKSIQGAVNQKIKQGLSVTSKTVSNKDAVKGGALSLFGQRYGEKVTVYSIGNYSKEICGGPHVKNTKELGVFKIIKETSAGANTRRVYAILDKDLSGDK